MTRLGSNTHHKLAPLGGLRCALGGCDFPLLQRTNGKLLGGVWGSDHAALSVLCFAALCPPIGRWVWSLHAQTETPLCPGGSTAIRRLQLERDRQGNQRPKHHHPTGQTMDGCARSLIIEEGQGKEAAMALRGLTYAMTKTQGWRTQMPRSCPTPSLNGEQAIIVPW